MGFQKMQSMCRWRLNALALFFLIDTLVRAVWRRKGDRIQGLIRFLWFLLKYLALMLISFFLLTWRLTIILSAYAWFRRIDDVIDTDAVPPNGYTRESYLAQKEQIIESLPHLGNCPASLLMEDVLIVHLLRGADRCGVDIVKEISNIWSVMCWDDKRRCCQSLATREEMVYYATLQDESILGVCVKIFNGDVQRFREVSGSLIGILTRTDWLFDLDRDMLGGIVNIPIDAVTEHELETTKLFAHKSWEELQTIPGFASWYAQELKTLNDEWTKTQTILGQDFGGVFSSRLLTFIFQKLLVEEFKCAFEKSTARVLI